MIFTIDKSADDYLATALQPNQRLRISLLGGGCSGITFNFDVVNEITEKDIEISAIVLIDRKSSLFLEGARLVYKNTIGSSLLTIESDKFKNSCGCGSSFSI